MNKRIFTLIGFVLLALVSFAIVSDLRLPHKVDQLSGVVSVKDFDKLKKLENQFCSVCIGQNSEQWQERVDLAEIVNRRNAILKKYGISHRINWMCRYDTGVLGKFQKCEVE